MKIRYFHTRSLNESKRRKAKVFRLIFTNLELTIERVDSQSII